MNQSSFITLYTYNTYNLLVADLSKLETYYEKISAYSVALMEHDAVNFAVYETALSEVETQYDVAHSQACEAMAIIDQSVPSPADAPSAQHDSTQRPVPNLALKPFNLSLLNTLEEVRGWKTMFKAYFDSSYFQHCNIDVQHEYLRSCLEPSLQPVVFEKVTPSMPIFSDDPNSKTCMDLIHQIFLDNYPIFNRRHDFFHLKASPDEPFSSAAQKLHSIGAECDLQMLTTEDLYLHRYVELCFDTSLREKFLSASTRSIKEFERIYKEHKACSSTVKSPDAVHVSAVREVPQTVNRPAIHAALPSRASRSPSPRRTQLTSSRSPSSSPLRVKFPNFSMMSIEEALKFLRNLCKRCGSDKHSSSDCPKKNVICNSCNRMGHFSFVCLNGRFMPLPKPRRGRPQFRSPSPQRTSRRQSISPCPMLNSATIAAALIGPNTPKIKLKVVPATNPRASSDSNEDITSSLPRMQTSKVFCKSICLDSTLNRLRTFASADKDYQSVIKAFIDNESPTVLPPQHPARAFKDIWNSITVQENLLILNSSRIIIPRKAVPYALSRLRLSHFGLIRALKTAKQFYFWPQMKLDIKNYIVHCQQRQNFRPSSTKDYEQTSNRSMQISIPSKPKQSILSKSSHSPLQPSTSVYVWDPQTRSWSEKGQILSQMRGAHSYRVHLNDRDIWRNRSYLQPV